MVKSGDKLHIGGRKWVIIMFMGQYEHTIDTKGRIIIPAKYRNELGDTFVITKGLDGCLFIYPSQEWIDRFCRQADGSFVKPEYKKITASVFIKGYGSYN